MAGKRKTRQGPQLVEIYQDIEAIYARKGGKSLWPNRPFKHKFNRGSAVLGVRRSGVIKLRKGDLIVRSRKGKPLWRFFDYE